MAIKGLTAGLSLSAVVKHTMSSSSTFDLCPLWSNIQCPVPRQLTSRCRCGLAYNDQFLNNWPLSTVVQHTMSSSSTSDLLLSAVTEHATTSSSTPDLCPLWSRMERRAPQHLTFVHCGQTCNNQFPNTWSPTFCYDPKWQRRSPQYLTCYCPLWPNSAVMSPGLERVTFRWTWIN